MSESKNTNLSIFVWGSNGAGQLGIGNFEDQNTPQKFPNSIPNKILVHSIQSGGCHTGVLNAESNLYIWGDNTFSQISSTDERNALNEPILVNPSTISGLEKANFKHVAFGWSQTIGVITREKSCEEIYIWGKQFDVMQSLRSLCVPSLLQARSTVASVACGWKHALLATSDGSVYSWGSGRKGQLALGPNILSVDTPTLVMKDSVINIVKCGWEHSIFFSSTAQTVWVAGSNRHGQLGVTNLSTLHPTGSIYEPHEILQDECIEQVDVGWHFNIVLVAGNKLYTWGKGSHGQLGNGSFQPKVHTPTQILVSVLNNSLPITQIACGSEHSLLLSQDGQVFSCGWDEHGNLGHGDCQNISLFKKIAFFDDNKISVQLITAAGAVSIAVGSSISDECTELVD